MINSNNDSVKRNVREAADIVEVINECITLKKAGSRFVGLCPFHGEKTPSFSVNPQGQFFYCFGCGESGDVFAFMMKYHHMGFPEALKNLADKYQIKLPEKQLSESEKRRLQEYEQIYLVNEAAAKLYEHCLADEKISIEARTYLSERGVPEEFIEKYRLGFAPSHEQQGWSYQSDFLQKKIPASVVEKAGFAVKKDRGGYYDRFRSRVMFPIFDMTGRIVAFGGRIVGDGKPKYMNSPESPVFEKSRLLFGLYNHKEAIRQSQRALIVEGNFDLLLLAVHGIDNVVAPLGTSLTPHHVKSLRGYCSEAILLFDADAAGLKAAMRSIPFFLAEQLDCRVAILPEGHDPDSLIREEGAAGIQKQIEKALPLAEFVFDTLVKQHGLTLSGKGKIIAELQPLLRDAVDASQRSLMVAHFSEKIGVTPAQLSGGGKLPQPPMPSRKMNIGSSILSMPRREKQILEFIILYPENLNEMQAAGIDKFFESDFAKYIIKLLVQLEGEGKKNPEQLLEVVSSDEEKNYVAKLLMEESEDSSLGEEGEGVVLGMKKEILAWLEKMNSLQEGVLIQEQIKEAEQRGDTTLLMELLRKKLDMQIKRVQG